MSEHETRDGDAERRHGAEPHVIEVSFARHEDAVHFRDIVEDLLHWSGEKGTIALCSYPESRDEAGSTATSPSPGSTVTKEQVARVIDEDYGAIDTPREVGTMAEKPNVDKGHGKLCVDCGCQCSAFAGNPNEWPVYLGDGWHHVGCIRKRMKGAAAERAQIVAWLLKEADEHAPRDMGVVIRGLAREIERGDHAQPAAPAERGRDEPHIGSTKHD